MPKSFVEVRIINPGDKANTFTSKRQTRFLPDGKDFVFPSRLPETASVSEHLKWLHGMLYFERKQLRQLQENGLEIICRIRTRSRSLDIDPEALLLMHQCHLRTEISFNP
jgi:hypothetical protein